MASALVVNDDALPGVFRHADHASIKAQNTYVSLVRNDLILIVVASLFTAAAVAAGHPWTRYLDAVAILALALALVLEILIETGNREGDWYDNRAVAETAKTASWRYMMRTAPFDDGQADAVLREVLEEAVRARPQFVLAIGQERTCPTDLMRHVREQPWDILRLIYLDNRVVNQRRWYASKALANEREARNWFRAGFTARVLALAASILFVVHPGLPGLVEFFATAGAASTAWNQLRRHRELSRSYGLAAQELSELVKQVEEAGDASMFSRAVLDTESAISREHTMWMAKRTEDPDKVYRALRRS